MNILVLDLVVLLAMFVFGPILAVALSFGPLKLDPILSICVMLLVLAIVAGVMWVTVG